MKIQCVQSVVLFVLYPREYQMDWVILTENNPETINCDLIRSFCWMESDDPKYSEGKFIVRFHKTSAYAYNVPKEVYTKMKERALHPRRYDRTPFQWFDDKIVEYHNYSDISDSGNLYVENIQSNDLKS